MAKAKSAATLKAEADFKELVASALQDMPATKKPYGWWRPTWAAGKLKSPSPLVVVRNGKYNSGRTAWWMKVHARLATKGMSYVTDSYLRSSFTMVQDADVVIMCPNIVSGVKVDVDGLSVFCMGAEKMPAKQVMQDALLDSSAYMTWPDDLGKVKGYAHVSSIWTARNFPKCWKESNGLNADQAAKWNRWPLLAEYIAVRDHTAWGIPQRAVCDVVKTISQNLAMEAQEAEMRRLAENNG